jgi:hypothetical protein
MRPSMRSVIFASFQLLVWTRTTYVDETPSTVFKTTYRVTTSGKVRNFVGQMKIRKKMRNFKKYIYKVTKVYLRKENCR